MNFHTTFPEDVSIGHFHQLMLGVVAPRPIGFVSSINKAGQPNLSPFSFFNAFGSNPPLLIYSAARRVRDGSTKHSYQNALSVKQVVINLVDYDMVEQCSLASGEYPANVNEFVKAGLTELPSLRVAPPRVGEAPASFECEVMQVIETGQEGGAGNLVLCKIVACHIAERLMTDNSKLNHLALDMVARMGGEYYARVNAANMFVVPKPNAQLGMGFDALPDSIFNADWLSRNQKARLAGISIAELSIDLPLIAHEMFSDADKRAISSLIDENNITQAWALILKW
jgi:flavin reductase (DIM6/NTAB) family NADH-FMN oxidoreductase RutF